MTERNTVDVLFHKLANAPRGMNVSNREVLAALGLLAQAILRHAYVDPIAEAQSFCGALMACVDPARLAQRQSLN
jgi:hypothetical protein